MIAGPMRPALEHANRLAMLFVIGGGGTRPTSTDLVGLATARATGDTAWAVHLMVLR